MIVIEAGTEGEKKNTLQLSGNVLSRKGQIEDPIFTSRTRDRPAILRGRPSEAKSSCLQDKGCRGSMFSYSKTVP